MNKEQGTLFVVATPIGNLADFSNRAKQTLEHIDLIACEDTRVSTKLLAHLHIKKPLVSFHQHSTDAKLRHILSILEHGSSVALLSDAGTPGISDPGGKLVEQAHKHGIRVIPIPGASAAIAALSVSGFPTDRFTFMGFPPHKKGRTAYFTQISNTAHTVVLYESKHRILKTLESLPKDRVIVVGRELTKLHEHLYRGKPDEVIARINDDSQKGEFVLVLSPVTYGK